MTLANGPDSYDLFALRKGWKAEEVLVISPYVEKQFFQTLINQLRPKRLHVVIDDGCRHEDREMVHAAVKECGLKRPPVLHLKVGSASGLVHMKLFYTVWRTPQKRRARSLVYGSANATRQGFSGLINAELIANCRLSGTRHGEAIRWCDEVIEGTRQTASVRIKSAYDIDMATGMKLRLPAFTVSRSIADTGSMDLWLQRGRLLSAYRPDPAFLHIPIHLAKGLPQADLANVAASAGFTVRQTKRLNYRYVQTDPGTEDEADDSYAGDADDDSGDLGNWRRKLFVWTHLGDWCSEACYEAHQEEFKRKGVEEREAALGQLETLRVSEQHSAAKARFLSSLDDLWARFGEDASSYLKGKTNLDVRYYSDLFDERVERDLGLAEEAEFRDRYIRGYELVQVPRFRNDVAGWRDFVGSFARQLCLDNLRGRSQSKVLKVVREALEATKQDISVLDTPEALLKALRDIWNETETGRGRSSGPGRSIGQMIAEYHSR